MLTKLLSSLVTLYIKTLNYHWNVESPRFDSLHKFFEGQYEDLAEDIDTVAERIRALGDYVPAGLKYYAQHSIIEDSTDDHLSDMKMIESLLHDRRKVVTLMKEILEEADSKKDIGTANMLEEMIQEYEKVCWMLEAHLH